MSGIIRNAAGRIEWETDAATGDPVGLPDAPCTFDVADAAGTIVATGRLWPDAFNFIDLPIRRGDGRVERVQGTLDAPAEVFANPDLALTHLGDVAEAHIKSLFRPEPVTVTWHF